MWRNASGGGKTIDQSISVSTCDMQHSHIDRGNQQDGEDERKKRKERESSTSIGIHLKIVMWKTEEQLYQ